MVLELEVVTEMTIDEFWDSDQLPTLLAVMLNIDPAKIKVNCLTVKKKIKYKKYFLLT